MINLYMTMNMKEKIYYLLFAVLMALFCTACNEEWTDEQYEHYVSFKAPMDYARGVTEWLYIARARYRSADSDRLGHVEKYQLGVFSQSDRSIL